MTVREKIKTINNKIKQKQGSIQFKQKNCYDFGIIIRKCW